MRRLCSQSPRSYLGRSAPRAPPLSQPRSGSTERGDVYPSGAEVSSGHSSGGSNDTPPRPKPKAAGTAAERSRQALKPNGGAWRRHDSEEPARKEGLLEQVLASENMRRAWEQVRANQGAAGIDGMTVQQFPSFARQHWPRIRQSLREQTYQPSAVRRAEIPKPDGGR
jgi:hypothetical protein